MATKKTTMRKTSPDFSIVTFTLFGVTYIYEGSSEKLLIVSGVENFPVKNDVLDALKNARTHHIPAKEQISKALIASGYIKVMPEITYTKNQPDNTLPDGAIS
jgi:hypothetical protein